MTRSWRSRCRWFCSLSSVLTLWRGYATAGWLARVSATFQWHVSQIAHTVLWLLNFPFPSAMVMSARLYIAELQPTLLRLHRRFQNPMVGGHYDDIILVLGWWNAKLWQKFTCPHQTSTCSTYTSTPKKALHNLLDRTHWNNYKNNCFWLLPIKINDTRQLKGALPFWSYINYNTFYSLIKLLIPSKIF